MGYLGIIKMALIAFPFVALILSIPIFIFQYRRYGAFIFWRAIVIYSFIFYLITAYFLIILPLPDVASVAKLTTPKYNLVPFTFVREFIKHSPLVITNPHTYAKALANSSFIQPFFNLMLTLPFGVYLRYYFKRSFKQVVLLGFLLSLFFELTQLSGLYFIYPRPYRLFDVDDLLLNTCGAMLGFAIAPLVTRFFPTPEEMIARTKINAEKVGYPRRFIAYLIDEIIGLLIIWGLAKFMNVVPAYFLMVAIYFILLPLVMNGQTFGKALVRIRIVNYKEKELSPLRLIWRQVQLWVIIIPGLFGGTMYFLAKTGSVPDRQLEAAFLMALLFIGLLGLYLISILLAWIFGTRLVYEKFSKTQEIAVLKDDKYEQ